MQITTNFSMSEYVFTRRTEYIPANLKYAEANLPKVRELFRVPQILRNKYGRIRVGSGVRCPELNAVIPNASKKSQHVKLEAVDLEFLDANVWDAWEWLCWESGLQFGQAILEGDEHGKPTWLHYSLGTPYRAANRCNEKMDWRQDPDWESTRNGYTFHQTRPLWLDKMARRV